MGTATTATSQATTASAGSSLWAFTFVLIPVVLLGGSVLFACLFKRSATGKTSISWITEKPRRLKALGWGVSVLLVAAMAALVDIIDFKDVLAGRDPSTNLPLLVLAAFAVGAYAFGLLVIWDCPGAQEQLLQDTRKRLTGAQQSAVVAEAEATRIRNDFQAYREFNRSIQDIVSQKWRRVCKQLQGSGPLSNAKLLSALDPPKQVEVILAAIHAAVRERISERLPEGSQLRLAYFEPDPTKNKLLVVRSFDGLHWDRVNTPNGKHANHFVLQGPDIDQQCLAIWNSLHGGLEPMIIEDADEAHARRDTPYRHFSDDQADAIKSIVCFACLRGDQEAAPHAVVTLDSNAPRAFLNNNETLLWLKQVLDPLCLRLLFERDMEKLLRPADNS